MHSDLPLVLLIDVHPSVTEEVKSLNYRVLEGSLGKPFRTTIDGNVRPLGASHGLPEGYQEADIVIVGMEIDPIDADEGKPFGHVSTPIPWYKATEYLIDPRGFTGTLLRDRFDEMSRRGAAFVVLAGPYTRQALFFGNQADVQYRLGSMQAHAYHPYEFLSTLTNLSMRAESGSHVALSEFGNNLDMPHEGSRFEVALPQVPTNSGELARNKDGRIVSFAYYDPKSIDSDRSGLLLFCHQVSDPLALPRWALEKVLPILSTHLYPKKASESWTQADPYQEPEVSGKLLEIQEVQAAAEAKVSALRSEVDAIRDGAALRLALLTSTGDELVDAVKSALEELGFGSVQDMDRQKADGERKKEDLRIVDGDFVALCEVKGLVGMPKEEDLTAVSRYVSMAVRELGNTQVRGLTIVNHQRLVAPLKRTNGELYDPGLDGLLVDQYVGVMSTWDLFRLVRSCARCGWSHEEVREVFDAAGRLRPIPPRFSVVGTIGHVWKQSGAFGIVLASGKLCVGDRYLVEADDGAWGGIVTSLQIDQRSVQSAKTGDEVGVVGSLGIDRIKNGSTLYVFSAPP